MPRPRGSANPTLPQIRDRAGSSTAVEARFATRVAATIAALACVLAGFGGCTSHYYRTRAQARKPSDAILPSRCEAPRTLAMFEGDTGRVATWYDLIEGVDWADVVIVGETHDNPDAHELERALVEDSLASFPGTAVSLEMFERNEQPDVDAYLRGEIDVATLVERTGAASWSPKDRTLGSWETFYQPIVDAAKVRDAPVVAANAPRSYVRAARTDGYAALRALPAQERALFDLPRVGDTGGYRTRFDEVMTPAHDEADEASAPDPEMAARLDAAFRSQRVWDATMANSIAGALDDGAKKVIHCVGSFHADYEGGLVQEIRAAKPFARVLIVTVVPEDSRALLDRDRGRADIVVYAPMPEPIPEPIPEPMPAPMPESTPGSPADPTERATPEPVTNEGAT